LNLKKVCHGFLWRPAAGGAHNSIVALLLVDEMNGRREVMHLHYVEYSPKPPLAPWVRSLWHVRVPKAVHRLERVLPKGRMQIVINLAQESCHGVSREGVTFLQEPALVIGVQRQWSLIDAVDMEEMVGVVFAPDGLRRFFAEPADAFAFAETGAEAALGAGMRSLRERLREEPTVQVRFALLERALLERMKGRREPHPAVRLMLAEIRRAPGTATVAAMTRSTGLSTRCLSELFREEVGVAPKLFCRIRRFQQVVERLHRGDMVPWPELALDCGYFDQSHFANDFKEFSGINPTTYVQTERVWANHLEV
jgi:AraC-like DNA-binding protein